MTPEQREQSRLYGEREEYARKLLSNGLNLQLKGVEALNALESSVHPGGELSLMGSTYTAQYDRLPGGAEAALAAFEQLKGLIDQTHQLMWQFHSGLQVVEPGKQLFPGLTPVSSTDDEEVSV